MPYKDLKQRKKYMKRYRQTIKYKQGQKLYRKDEAYKKYQISEKRKKSQNKHSQTSKFKKAQKKYNRSILGKYNNLRKSLRRKEKLNNCVHSFTKNEWLLKYKSCNGFCPCCHNPFDNYLHKLSLDHILSLYWANEYFKATGIKYIYTINEIMPLCLKCNKEKGNKLIF